MRKSIIHLKLLFSAFQALDAGFYSLSEGDERLSPMKCCPSSGSAGWCEAGGTEISSYCSTLGYKDP